MGRVPRGARQDAVAVRLLLQAHRDGRGDRGSASCWLSCTCRRRRVFLSPCSFKPDAAWMAEQARAFLEDAKAKGLPVGVVLRDRDSKFTAAFDSTVLAEGTRVKRRWVFGRRT